MPEETLSQARSAVWDGERRTSSTNFLSRASQMYQVPSSSWKRLSSGSGVSALTGSSRSAPACIP